MLFSLVNANPNKATAVKFIFDTVLVCIETEISKTGFYSFQFIAILQKLVGQVQWALQRCTYQQLDTFSL